MAYKQMNTLQAEFAGENLGDEELEFQARQRIRDAIKELKEMGYVDMEDYGGAVSPTEAGLGYIELLSDQF